MIRSLRAVVPFVVCTLGPQPLFALIRPSFSLDDCGWRATHIVVVTKGTEIGGRPISSSSPRVRRSTVEAIVVDRVPNRL